MDEELDREIKFDAVPALEFIYEKVSVIAEVEEEVSDGKGGYSKIQTKRNILKECSGKFEPGTMTAILGPSGSGKTTMLNLLSGRLLSTNLTLRGRIMINGKIVEQFGDFKGVIGYVMQQDLMLPTFTPRQSFRFVTDMRLPHKTSQEKDKVVQSMIQSLGLTKCSETYIGNSLIRGLSGGEKKRTSVGIELLINPSLIFLDEPTTGLDSTTALNLIKFLNRLSNAGRTVVTTIHQPSSQIFREFDTILLMLDGNIVYNNRAQDSMKYFSRIGLPVPSQSNPMDHYMKIMNKQGIMLQYIEQQKQITQEEVNKQFKQRVEYLVINYKNTETSHQPTIFNSLQNHGENASWCTQFIILLERSFLNQLRNPLGLRVKFVQVVFFAVITIILYERQAKDIDSYLQNLMGVIFFLTMNTNFSSIFGAINIFSQERPVFIRERLSNTYDTVPYFLGRSIVYVPLDVIITFLLIVICYFVIHLDNSGEVFIMSVGAAWLGSWMSSAYGLLLSTAFSDPEVAITLVPILIIPLMLVGGLFAPLENVPDFYKIFEYISMFKYQFESMIYAQFHNKRDGFTININNQSYSYQGDILGKGSQLYFADAYWVNMFLMGIIGIAIRVLSLIALKIVSNPPNIKLLPPEPSRIIANPQIILVKSGESGNSNQNSEILNSTSLKNITGGESSMMVLN